jgi:hypothetical protein
MRNRHPAWHATENFPRRPACLPVLPDSVAGPTGGQAAVSAGGIRVDR